MDVKTFTVSRDDSVYEAFPALAMTSEEHLVCVYLECTRHTDRSFTQIVYRTSKDRGRTWSGKKALTENTTGLDYFYDCPSIVRLRDGRLVIVTNKVKHGDSRFLDSENELIFGDASGERWSEPLPTPVKGIVPDTLCELPSGRWLLAAHRQSERHGKLEQMLWYTDDNGKTWSEPVTLASDEGLNLCEASILALPDGTLAAFMRENSGEGWDGYKSLSTDGGETWSGPYRMPIPGCHRPVARMLNSGNVMITYRFYQGGPVGYGSIQSFFAAWMAADAVKETDRRKQWVRLMPVDYDRSPMGDSGYSGWVQFKDGEIYIVQYIMDDSTNCQIRGYSLREEAFVMNG